MIANIFKKLFYRKRLRNRTNLNSLFIIYPEYNPMDNESRTLRAGKKAADLAG